MAILVIEVVPKLKIMQKYIGVLGGLGYKATLLAYQKLNQLYHAKKGKAHTCPIRMLSIDFNEIDSLLPNRQEEAAQLLQSHIEEVDSYNTGCTLIFNNTLHQAFDILAPKLDLQKPFGHIGKLLNKELSKKQIKKAILVGTKYTMNAGYIASFIPINTQLVLPCESLQNKLEQLRKIYYHDKDETLALTCFNELKSIGADTIILACTEHSIAFAHFPKAYFTDTMELQCAFGVSLVTAENKKI